MRVFCDSIHAVDKCSITGILLRLRVCPQSLATATVNNRTLAIDAAGLSASYVKKRILKCPQTTEIRTERRDGDQPSRLIRNEHIV